MRMSNRRSVVIIEYDEIIKNPSENRALHAKLEEAYGLNSIGVLGIRNVPSFVELKQSFLPMAHDLAKLPQDYLETQVTDPESLFNAGWSYGKEKLGDKADLSKGSFYFNPLTDSPGTPQERQQYPASYPCNKWPSLKLPEFEKKAKQMGVLMKDVVVHLSKHIDAFAKKKNENYTASLYDAMKSTEKAKGRLLYYFPLQGSSASSIKEDSWIGWHNDSGFLTALAGDFYINHATGQLLDRSPDPDAGLYVVDRQNSVVQVDLPSDCLAVQMGECVQILTGGAVVATPHCVRGASSPGIARISLPMFIDTPPHFPLKMPADSQRQHVLAIESPKVPPLGQRWTEDGMTFGDFLQKTFQTYYEWSESN